IGVLALSVVGLGAAWWLSSGKSPESPAAAAVQPRSVPLDVPARAPAPPLRAPEPAARPPVPAAAPAQEPVTAASPASSFAPPAPRTFDDAPLTARVEPLARPVPASTEPPLPSASSLAAEGIAVPPLRLEL